MTTAQDGSHGSPGIELL